MSAASSISAFPPPAWQILVPTVLCLSGGDVQGLSARISVDISLHLRQETLPCREQACDPFYLTGDSSLN